jgi:endo-1,4-beta-xylanase
MEITRREFAVQGSAAMAAMILSTRAGAQGAASAKAVSIRSAAASRGLLAGCAVAAWPLREDAGYKALVQAQAGIVVAESAFKFGPIHPGPQTYFFRDSDALVEFAEANGIKVRGHNFVWHRQLPDWFAGYVTPQNAEQVLVDHIERVGGRYAGKLHSWDVVNEAIQVSDGLPGGLRNSPWQKLLPGSGPVPAYIEIAYRTTRRVDPKALLVYNDYGIEGEDEGSAKKREAVLGLLRGMQQRGVPIDALGVQSHISAGPGKDGSHTYGAGLRNLIATVRGMGLKVLLTEMDVNDRALPAAIPARDAAVAEAYANYLKITLADPAVIALLTWGITDKYTWLNHEDSRADKLPERCLPFDADLQPVPAFKAEVDALRQAPERG